MAESAGYGGYVKRNSTVVAGMKSWNVPQLANVGDITDFQSSGLKEFLLLLKEWSATFEGSLDGTPLTLGTTYVMHFGITGSTEYYGNAIITGITPATTVDGINTLSYTCQGTAGLTFTP